MLLPRSSDFPDNFACLSCHAIRPAFYLSKANLKLGPGSSIRFFKLNWDVAEIERIPCGFVCPDCKGQYVIASDFTFLPWVFAEVTGELMEMLDEHTDHRGEYILLAREIISQQETKDQPEEEEEDDAEDEEEENDEEEYDAKDEQGEDEDDDKEEEQGTEGRAGNEKGRNDDEDDEADWAGTQANQYAYDEDYDE